MAKTTSSKAVTVSQRLRARLDAGSGDSAADGRLRSIVDFRTCIRNTLAANDASIGLGALDEVAAATILQDGATLIALTQTVLLLANPNVMSSGMAPENEAFAPPAAPARPKRPSKRISLRSTKPPPAKKQRTSGPLPFDVPPDIPEVIIDDLRRLEQDAASKGKTPSQLAYPWSGKRAWYDPRVYADLHLAHWRFYVKHRAVFFLLALYAPSMDSSGRRKQNANAIKARLQFLSRNIEEFGWFGFLDRYENAIHDTLM
jgi:hypothetical protein